MKRVVYSKEIQCVILLFYTFFCAKLFSLLKKTNFALSIGNKPSSGGSVLIGNPVQNRSCSRNCKLFKLCHPKATALFKVGRRQSKASQETWQVDQINSKLSGKKQRRIKYACLFRSFISLHFYSFCFIGYF